MKVVAALTLPTQLLIHSRRQIISASSINTGSRRRWASRSLLAFELALTFGETGDPAGEGCVENLCALLDQGIGVTFVYGDQDYMCYWSGGECPSPIRLWEVFNALDIIPFK